MNSVHEEVRRLAKEINASPVWRWPTAPCNRCGEPSRLVGACDGRGECFSCTMRFRGEDDFDMNAMHQPIEETD